MSFIIRTPAVIGDLWKLHSVMRPADLARYGVQLARSASFALVDWGRTPPVFAAGGLYADDAAGERVCWMLAAKAPPARDLLTGVRMICDHAGPGYPLVAYIDSTIPRDVRFAEMLGFVSSAREASPSLPAQLIRMERRAW